MSKQRKVNSPNKSRDSKALTSAKHVSGSEESKADKKGGKIKSPKEKVKRKTKVELMMTDGKQDTALHEWVVLIDQRHPTDRINDTILTNVYNEMIVYDPVLKSVPFEQAKAWRKAQKQRCHKKAFNEKQKSKSKSKDSKDKAGAKKGDSESQPDS